MFTINKQLPESRLRYSDGSLQVHSLFKTIQGEGPFAGMRSVFIRLTGCNLQCPGCDTEYTNNRVLATPADILRSVSVLLPKNDENLVVITGGEPFRQNIGPLVQQLIEHGYYAQIETNGTLAPTIHRQHLGHENLTIVCSPKTGSVNPELRPYIDAYKYVLNHQKQDPDDGLPEQALDHPVKKRLARPHEGFDGPVYLQPQDVQHRVFNKFNVEACVAACLKHGYILQLQIHKLIEVE
jgi:organic radical activating enzyme